MSAQRTFHPAPSERLSGLPALGIGMIGYAFMGRAHANAYHQIPSVFWPPQARLKLIALCGRTGPAVADAAARYGFLGYYILGWEHLHINLIQHFIAAIVRGEPVEPWGATFEDGYRAAVIAAAIAQASRTGNRIPITYETP